MDTTELWWRFWTGSFIVAGLSFAAIAAVVAVRGLWDLRSLIRTLAARRLQEKARGQERPADPQYDI